MDMVGLDRVVVEVTDRVRCQVLVIHGDDDRVIPHAAGGGHIPNAREPVLVSLPLRDFAEQAGAR